MRNSESSYFLRILHILVTQSVQTCECSWSLNECVIVNMKCWQCAVLPTVAPGAQVPQALRSRARGHFPAPRRYACSCVLRTFVWAHCAQVKCYSRAAAFGLRTYLSAPPKLRSVLVVADPLVQNETKRFGKRKNRFVFSLETKRKETNFPF